MIVTCPSCNSRYKIDEAKIKGRGAKITCPTCAHKFVVYREGEEAGPGSAHAPPDELASEAGSPPSDLGRRDFRKVGITWKVRKGIGLTYDFHDLNTLRDYLADGQVHPSDVLSYDARAWHPLKEIPDLDRYFWDVWRRAEAGEIQVQQPDDESDDEDESDAPTTIVGHGSSLADEIRQAVKEATTPAPAARRTDTEPVIRQAPQASQQAAALATAPKPAPPEPAPAPAPLAGAAPAPAAKPAPSGGRGGLVVVALVAVVLIVVAVLWALGVFDTMLAAT